MTNDQQDMGKNASAANADDTVDRMTELMDDICAYAGSRDCGHSRDCHNEAPECHCVASYDDLQPDPTGSYEYGPSDPEWQAWMAQQPDPCGWCRDRGYDNHGTACPGCMDAPYTGPLVDEGHGLRPPVSKWCLDFDGMDLAD